MRNRKEKNILYKITCIVNNKLYFGISMYDLKYRIYRHKKSIENIELDTKLIRAFKKYGFEKFTFSIVEELGKNKWKNVQSLEKYYIKKYNTYYDGYNSTFGGDGGNTLLEKM